jgi:hypothetical protein
MDESSLAVLRSDQPGDFRRWLANARPGDRCTYYEGFIAPGLDADGRPLAEAERKKVLQLAQLAWSAAAGGMVHLLQRRLGENRYVYIATARRVQA